MDRMTSGTTVQEAKVGLFHRKRRQAPPKRVHTAEADLHDRALPRLREQAATNSRLAALLDEIDRGRERRQGDSSDAVLGSRLPESCTCRPGPASVDGHVVLDLGGGFRVYEIGVDGYLAVHYSTGVGAVVSSPVDALEQLKAHRAL